MIDEKIMTHAVTLAAAFIANGDIRCGGNTRPKETCFSQIHDIIPTLYYAVRDAQAVIVSGAREVD